MFTVISQTVNPLCITHYKTRLNNVVILIYFVSKL